MIPERRLFAQFPLPISQTRYHLSFNINRCADGLAVGSFKMQHIDVAMCEPETRESSAPKKFPVFSGHSNRILVDLADADVFPCDHLSRWYRKYQAKLLDHRWHSDLFSTEYRDICTASLSCSSSVCFWLFDYCCDRSDTPRVCWIRVLDGRINGCLGTDADSGGNTNGTRDSPIVARETELSYRDVK